MNIEEKEELIDATPAGFISLNDECVQTNTKIDKPRPYDHVMYNAIYTTEIDTDFNFKVINLINTMKIYWEQSQTGIYPGDPYNHNLFKQYYSDHNPIVFKMIIPDEDDD